MTDPFPHSYLPHTEAERQEMLAVIGVGSVDELFADIPDAFRNPALSLPPALTELELFREIGGLAKRNAVPGDYPCFVGGGVYRHFIPSVVGAMISRGEFLTSYTPYQPEVSQGTLQATYEYQSMISEITGMEAANAGMYDGASSLAEAALMACRVTGRHSVIVHDTVNPRYRAVVDTYLLPQGVEIATCAPGSEAFSDATACVLAQYPDYYGVVRDLTPLADRAHEAGALLAVSADPVALGMFRAPGDMGADIVTGETQPIGVNMSFGGPYVGYFACKMAYIRQMPGRIAGRTVDHEGRIGYALTLQTREQHIRRERATSNICTSEALIATGTAVALAALGPGGLRQMAELSYQKAHYAASEIGALDGYEVIDNGAWFNEFVVRCPLMGSQMNASLWRRGIIGGIDVGEAVENGLLLSVTEMNTREEIDALVGALREIAEGGAR
ncbi:MAG: aminomethyl-transferring glycine dehydrogenase subunit GcvPA [Chloroflexota bacterium]|nr:aminomethyl-transferring glycine dehydrogenase subunit GcvPA [Chloroflexota bacterium]MDE2969985.1 aminomethyl-transferring glycine dehydrogenase subunit GcvPA [Chloroflexota bacterium]